MVNNFTESLNHKFLGINRLDYSMIIVGICTKIIQGQSTKPLNQSSEISSTMKIAT